MIRKLRPLRHVLPAVALVFAASAWLFPPYFDSQHSGLATYVEPLAIASALVGWLLTTRRPENPIGWIFSAWAVGVAFNAFAGQYVDHNRVHPGLPGASWVGWFGTILWHPGFGLYVLILLLFPTGTPLTARWRRFAWFTVAWYAALGLTVAAYPKVVLPEWYSYLRPPFGTPAQPVGNAAYGILLTGNLFLIAIAMWSLIVRYRVSAETQRYQIKWFVWPTVGGLAMVLVAGVLSSSGFEFPYVLPVIPLSAGLAILRYRLYDIDRVVSRSVAWLLLTVVVVGVYVGVVAGATAVLPGSSSIAVAAATLAAAAVFEPARRRLQASVDRRFNRERYNAAQLVDGFAGGLRESVDLSRVEHELLDVTTRSMQPASVSLWLPTVETPA